MRELFEATLTVPYIASSLASFDAERDSVEVRSWATSKEFDQVGVRRDGSVSGYVLTAHLGAGPIGKYCQAFTEDDIADPNLPLLDALRRLKRRPVLFVKTMGSVNGLVTVADVARPPVRLWLFGLVMIAEMHMTRLARAVYSEESLPGLIPPDRVRSARNLLKRQRKEGLDVDLIHCLGFGDKSSLIAESQVLRDHLDFASDSAARARLEAFRRLRNDLAHGTNISKRWPGFLEVAEDLERLIDRAQGVRRSDVS